MESKYICYKLVLYLCLIKVALLCTDHKTCTPCLRDPSVCVWCADVKSTSLNGTRCRSANSVDSSWCPDHLQQTQNQILDILGENNKDFTAGEDGIQMKPQLYDLVLRPGQPQDFTFSYQLASNYPVDLYFLLDVSLTMLEIKKTIVNDSQPIYETMQSMTNNTRLGFGTFVDKNAMPFSRLIKNKEAYSFKHHLNLTRDYEKFQAVVDKTDFGKNRDQPESGLEALAQVMACKDLIDWREKARKIVVLLTDSTMHVVGDGRNAGILQPYDGKCYTTHESGGVYTKELIFDYPSIGMINKLASETGIMVFFVLTKPIYEKEYQLLQKAIKNSKLAILKNTEQLVYQLKSFYEEITSNIKLVVSNQEKFEIELDPDCTKDRLKQCQVDVTQQKDFKGTVTLRQYYGSDNEKINISLQGTNDKLMLNVKVLNKCPCQVNSTSHTQCNGEKLDCGVCICDNDRFGNYCECHKDDVKTEKEVLLNCIPLPKNTSKVCSGNGDCHCGQCRCNPDFLGLFCEHSNQNCISDHSALHSTLCSGHGSCIRNESNVEVVCHCTPPWIGPKCGCKNTTKSCNHVVDGKLYICNNRGDCICDSCQCKEPMAWDKRVDMDSLCRPQPCPICHSLQCDVIRPCALCHLDSGNCDNECEEGIVIEKKHDEIPSEYLNSSEWGVCDHEKINVGCYTRFVYKYDDQNYRILIHIQEDNDCAEVYYVYGGVVLGSLLLGGILALLAWKCITNYQDRKEFDTFVKQHEDILTGPCDNPLYKEAQTTYNNPAFNRSFKS